MAPLRRLLLCLCLPLLLPPPAAPVPVSAPRTDWAACRSLSRELSRLVATLKEPHRVLVSAGGSAGGDRGVSGHQKTRGIAAGGVLRGCGVSGGLRGTWGPH